MHLKHIVPFYNAVCIMSIFDKSKMFFVKTNFCLLSSLLRVFKGSEDVRLMRPASPESRSPDTNQGSARSVTPPTAAEPDTTQSGPSRETTEGLVTMMRCVRVGGWLCVM